METNGRIQAFPKVEKDRFTWFDFQLNLTVV